MTDKLNFKNSLRTISKLNRKKQDPESFSFTGDLKSEDIELQLIRYTKEEFFEEKSISVEKVTSFQNNGYTDWLNIYGLNKTDAIVSACEKQGIHTLVIQDILDINQRPKFQEFEEFSFLTLKSILPTDSDYITDQISFVFNESYLISFQERKAAFFEHIRYRLREDKGNLRERGTDFLLYTLLESILDNYFKTLSKLDEEIEQLNFGDLNKEWSPDILMRIEKNKKMVQFIQKSILPIKEFTLIVERGNSQFIELRHIKYFLEIKDLCLTLLDSCDILNASLESSINLFFSIQGHRMNQVMKTLTVVATIFIPLTFIAGVYGMNFHNMPELEWRFGYLGFWVINLIVLSTMLIYFKKKKWF